MKAGTGGGTVFYTKMRPWVDLVPCLWIFSHESAVDYIKAEDGAEEEKAMIVI